MMVRGRKPKSTELKLLDGNAGQRAINEDAPKPSLAKNTKPFHWLSKPAQQIWRRSVPELIATGQLTKVDVDAFAAYCSACATFQQCEEFINKNGMTYESESVNSGVQIKKRPEVAIRSDALKIIRSFASEFGLTPSARTRIKIEQPDKVDELEQHRRKRRPARGD